MSSQHGLVEIQKQKKQNLKKSFMYINKSINCVKWQWCHVWLQSFTQKLFMLFHSTCFKMQCGFWELNREKTKTKTL